MQLRKIIKENLNNVVEATDLNHLGEKYVGKVRDTYTKENTRYLVTTDRISCFDRVITTIPFKGQVLTQMANFWFDKTKDICPNHLIDSPDPNVMIVKNCEIIPIEVIVRSYLTGSAWRDYQAGKDISGINLPTGMKMSEKFPEPLVTPSTKAPHGEHDLPISEQEIIDNKMVDPDVWNQVRNLALELFIFGQVEALKQGLLFVDTKYEFGICDGQILLADEIHTLDSSRYWQAESYQECFEQGQSPEMLDKENVRQWLLDRGFKGDGKVPAIPDEYRIEVAELYLNSYQMITGRPLEISSKDVNKRIARNLS